MIFVIDKQPLNSVLRPPWITTDPVFGGGVRTGKGHSWTILVNGTEVARGRIERTQPGISLVDDLAGIGLDEGTAVAGYANASKFSGRINNVTIEQN
jgi:arylsulfatase